MSIDNVIRPPLGTNFFNFYSFISLLLQTFSNSLHRRNINIKSTKMSNHCVQIPTWITFDYLQQILQNLHGENSIAVKNFDITPGSSVGNNFVCQILRVQVEYARGNQNEKRNIIAKVLPKTELSKELKKSFDFFSVEMKVMSETLPLIYKELSGKMNAERLFPHVYHSDIQNNAIFMEDLKVEGYVLADKKLSLDLDHVLLVVQNLAKMQAASYLLFEKNPSHKEHYLEWFWKKSDAVVPGKLLDEMYNILLKFLNLWSISKEDKNIFRSFKGKIADVMTEAYRRKESNFNVLLHGDCWTTNMMFRYINGKVNSVKFFDYQVSNYNSIGLDLNYFVFTSAMEYVKINHLEDVFKTYFDTFVQVTGEIEGFTTDTVREEFSKGIGFGFAIAVTLRCSILSDGMELDSFVEGKDAPNNNKIFQNKEFISEVVNLLPIFKKYGIFKLQ